MKRGDLVLYQDSHWIVQVHDARRTKTALLLKADGTTEEVAHDLDIPIVANPSQEWPFVTVPEKPRWGRVTTVSWVRNTGLTQLVPFADWMLSDPVRSGGSLFLRPGLGLQRGHILQVAFEKGVVNVPITVAFGTVATRQARATVKKPLRPATIYDRLTANDEDFDE